jgi:2,4-dienoyl-CoA reductase-like NADH-dependent reductase (Old Yellow Enzyme family)
VPKLTDPITIRGMEVKNRLGFPPMLSFSSDEKGRPTEGTYMIYEQKARGGVGLITYEATSINTNSLYGSGAYIGSDENIPAYKKMANILHKYNVKIGMQLADNGIIHIMPRLLLSLNTDIIGPSNIDLVYAASAYDLMIPSFSNTVKENGWEIRELDVNDIQQFQDDFATAAKRVIQAGFDFVEIHSAHATLHAAFLAPYYNKRTDEYGGSVENRLRFLKETVEKTRAQIGDKPPIFVRISADELLNEGLRIEDSKEIAQQIEKMGVDCLDVSQGNMIKTPYGIQIPTYYEQGAFIHLAEAIKKVVNIPVIGVGRIIDMKKADEYIQQEKADIIYMGRQLICDPDTPNKYWNGQLEDIQYCTGCLQGCNLAPQTCIYDSFSGRNYKPITPSSDPKKVVVLGAGPAGLEAARMLKLRGHDVEIFEKSDKIGGLVPLIAAEHKKEDFMNIIQFLETQLKKLNVPIHLNKKLTKQEITELNPDILILAVGSEATLPVNLKGKPNVLTQDEAIMKSKPIGKNVVVWGLETYWKGGAETAITLAEQGYNIKALVGPEVTIAGLVLAATGRRVWILEYFKNNNIPVYPRARLLDVDERGLKFLDETGTEQFIEADTVIYCGSRISLGKALKKEYKVLAPKVEAIGDGKKPRDIQAALKDAQTFVRRLK